MGGEATEGRDMSDVYPGAARQRGERRRRVEVLLPDAASA